MRSKPTHPSDRAPRDTTAQAAEEQSELLGAEGDTENLTAELNENFKRLRHAPDKQFDNNGNAIVVYNRDHKSKVVYFDFKTTA